MDTDLFSLLHSNGFIKPVRFGDEEIFVWATPCRVKISENIVEELKAAYLPDAEIGGILLAQPEIINGEKIFFVEQVRFIRNAVEDIESFREDGVLRTKANAYLPDIKEATRLQSEAYRAKVLPLKFHTHPTKGKDILDSFHLQAFETNTSKQDLKESKYFNMVNGKKLLLPRALIVGNSDWGKELFIGIYDGFIAPGGFDETKSMIRQENISKLRNGVAEAFRKWDVSEQQKWMYGIGAVLLLGFLLYRTRKFSIPVVAGLTVILPVLLSQTTAAKDPPYYNWLKAGDVDIFIPKEEGEFYPK